MQSIPVGKHPDAAQGRLTGLAPAAVVRPSSVHATGPPSRILFLRVCFPVCPDPPKARHASPNQKPYTAQRKCNRHPGNRGTTLCVMPNRRRKCSTVFVALVPNCPLNCLRPLIPAANVAHGKHCPPPVSRQLFPLSIGPPPHRMGAGQSAYRPPSLRV